ncbi:MAG: hypothetical protein JJE36_03660 [Coriobacteriia bacterium]|nr:hypothetical protein [Coriobacteriia bacterium]
MRGFVRSVAVLSIGLVLGLLVQGCSGASDQSDAGQSSSPDLSSSATPVENSLLKTDGWGDIRIGATESQVSAVLGEPASQEDFPEMNGESAVVFYNYFDAGIQVSFIKPSMTVGAVFFYAGTGDHSEYSRFAGDMDKGMSWASSPDEVLAAYGSPVNDYQSDDGGLEWRRLAYRDISFRFQNGELETVAVGAD